MSQPLRHQARRTNLVARQAAAEHLGIAAHIIVLHLAIEMLVEADLDRTDLLQVLKHRCMRLATHLVTLEMLVELLTERARRLRLPLAKTRLLRHMLLLPACRPSRLRAQL